GVLGVADETAVEPVLAGGGPIDCQPGDRLGQGSVRGAANPATQQAPGGEDRAGGEMPLVSCRRLREDGEAAVGGLFQPRGGGVVEDPPARRDDGPADDRLQPQPGDGWRGGGDLEDL